MDAVLAVAMTILVLDLRTPRLTPAVRADRLDYSFLLEQGPRFVAFGVSFFSIAIYWGAMVTLFRRAAHASYRLVWFVLVFLFFICLVPWATGFLAEYPAAPQAVATYAGTWTCVGVGAALIQHHLAWTAYPNDPVGLLEYRINLGVLASLVLVTVLSAFVTVHAALAILPILWVPYVIPRRTLMRLFRIGEHGVRRTPSGQDPAKGA
jgi:uncharacterized membrane protein